MKTTNLGAVLLAALLSSTALAGDENVIKGELGQKLDRTVQLQSKGGYWGTVLVAKGGEVVLSKGYGNADYAARPNTPRTLFEIASVSKMFTAAAILKLEAQGKLKTSDGLDKFFDKVPADKKAITVQQLLNHTSGISPELGLPYDAKETRDELVTFVLEAPLASAPDEKFEYCNVAYALLAAIVEKASGQSFEQYSKEQLFVPAGMKDTAFINDAGLDKARAAVRLSGTALDRTAVEWNWSWGYRGMGGVVTTAEDLYKFDRALRANQVLDEATQKKQTTPVKDMVGSGCFVEKTFRGTRKVYHSGGVGGFTSMFSRYLEDDVTVVILTNDAGDPSGLEAALLNAIFPPPTAALTLDLGKEPPPSPIFMKEGSTWKGKRADANVVLEVRRADKTWATLTLSEASAKALRAMVQDGIEERSREKIPEGDAPSMETDIYYSSYTPEEGKVEVERTALKVLPKYVSEGHDGEAKEDHRLTLILMDEAAEFWPVFVKMNSAAAKSLLKELDAALAPK